MKRFEAWAIWLILGTGLCGCTRTSEVKTSEKTAFQEELKGRERDRSTEVVQTGPETITTTVEEWGPAAAEEVKSGSRESNPPSRFGRPMPEPLGQTRTASLPPPAVLIKRTVTVDQRGPSTDTKTNVATKVESASLTEKQEKASDTKKRTSWWPPIWMWACGAALLGLGGWALKRGVKIASL